MKQNERWLVYAVTGFLALILVVAVLFRGDTSAGQKKLPGLAEIFDKKKPDGDPSVVKNDSGAGIGVPGPGAVAPQPLNAVPPPKAMLAADFVAQSLGPSTRQHTVRMVYVKTNDTLEGLVRRWCGLDASAKDETKRLVEETKMLNEELSMLRAGQQIALPWVDDEVLRTAIEAQKPRTLVAEAGTAGSSTTGAVPAVNTPGPAVSPANATTPPSVLPANNEPAVRLATVGGVAYTVKDGDSLWKISERHYGRKNADRMIGEIKAANPGLTDSLRANQKIVLPKDSKLATAGQ